MTSTQSIIKRINQFALAGKSFFLVVDFELKQPVFYAMDELEKEDIQLQFPHVQRLKPYTPTASNIELAAKPMSEEEYSHKFKSVMKNLQYGNSFLTNLTAETPLESKVSLQDVFHLAQAKYKILYKQEWVCFSPEIFIQIENGKIRSFPMKGTIDASIPDAENQLLQDAKEKAEHFTIVDLIRNDLSRVASHVTVKRFRYLDIINTQTKQLLQASSEIEGELPLDYKSHLGELIFQLLPAGSISGAPKTKTLDIIHEAEQYTRGFYTGVAFYYDGETLDSCVLIRFIEKTTNGLVYKSGGGITIQSDMQKEYQELLNKIYVPISC